MQRALPFSILKPVPRSAVWKPQVDPADVLVGLDADRSVAHMHVALSTATHVVLDVETRGLESWLPNTAVVGLGIAWISTSGDWNAKYFDIQSMQPQKADHLFGGLSVLDPSKQHIVGHNAMFDAAMLWMERRRRGISEPVEFTHCTLGLYKQLAGEGWSGQEWGLKSAQCDLLGWADSNEERLDHWLIGNGWHKQGPKIQPGEGIDEHVARCREWVAENPKTRTTAPTKGEMWRAPASILGEYCILDCLSTLQLYIDVLRPALDRFPQLEKFHRGVWMDSLYLLVAQQYDGIRIDRVKLEDLAVELRGRMAAAEVAMRQSGVLGGRIAAIERKRFEVQISALQEREPEKFNRVKETREPIKFRKDGQLAKSWIGWNAKRDLPPVVNKNWTNWYAKMEALDALGTPQKRFSPSSGDDLRELLFDSGLVVSRAGDPWQNKKKPGTFFVTGKNGEVELDCAESGAWSCDVELFSQLDVWAEPLAEYKDAFKELGSFVEPYLELLHQHPNGEWRLHPGWKMCGTITQRLAGVEPNLQQIPKSIKLMDCFIPDDGWVWIEGDWTALEPHVLAELSHDPGLLELYGPGAAPHDRYLFSAARYPGSIGEKVRQYYTGDVTKEMVSTAKRECKFEREVGKLFVLAGDYGASARKLWRSSQVKGIRLTLEQAQQIHEAQHELHAGVYNEFGPALEAEWRRRGGWVYSGLGHPVAVDADKTKDLINRVVQKTGHDIHTMFISTYSRVMAEVGIEYRGIVWDFHDQFIIQVREGKAEEALDIARWCVGRINADLAGIVPLKLDPRIVHSLSEAKLEEEYNKRAVLMAPKETA